jgi:hypothetical protein
VDNPNAINPIFYLTSARPKHLETMNDGTEQAVPHILKDGADSIGAAGAALRVYINIGTCGAQRMQAEDVLVGIAKDQAPFRIAEADARCQDWQLTKARIPNAAKFLDAQHGFKLPAEYISQDVDQLATGRRAFARNCARCHSSKVPPGLDAVTKHDRANAGKWVAFVERPDFLDDNFLSDDRRYPVVHSDWRFAIGTNIKRTMGSNAAPGHIWNDFSSKTYKELPSPGTIRLYNPFDPAQPIDFKIPDGKGYYRPPSLLSVWATAPLLHNNSLGVYTRDPSIEGRLRAFEDAMDKMFHPQKRDGIKSIKRTTNPSVLQMGAIEIKVPAGTPVDLIANVNLRALLRDNKHGVMQAIFNVLKNPRQAIAVERGLRTGQTSPELRAFANRLLALNTAPDFIEDHGHEFGSRLSPEEQRALIEYLKTF